MKVQEEDSSDHQRLPVVGATVPDMLTAIEEKCDGWLEYMESNLLSTARSRYNQVLGLDARSWAEARSEVLAAHDRESMLDSAASEERRRDSFDSEQAVPLPTVAPPRLYGCSAFLPPQVRSQRLIVFCPRGYQASAQAESGGTTSVGRMYEWTGVIRRKGHGWH